MHLATNVKLAVYVCSPQIPKPSYHCAQCLICPVLHSKLMACMLAKLALVWVAWWWLRISFVAFRWKNNLFHTIWVMCTPFYSIPYTGHINVHMLNYIIYPLKAK